MYEIEGEKRETKKGRRVRRRERDEELNASSYPQRSTALKPFHNFLLAFLSELGFIQSMCVCVCVFIGSLYVTVVYPWKMCAWEPVCHRVR